MLLWAGLILVLGGVLCLPIDRRATHFIYDTVPGPLHDFLDSITHMAKAGHWLLIAAAAYLGAEAGRSLYPGVEGFTLAAQFSTAFVVAIGGASVVLHSLKFLLGRRRPRDEIEMNLYAFIPFSFDLQHNSFPSGHALTIFCVAVIASAAMPAFWVLWFVIAAGLGFTRALLTAHFLSDVFIGAGIGTVAGREALVYLYPQLAPGWF